MVKEGKTIYRSRIDWWLWAVILLAVAAVIAACIGVQQWYFKWDFLLIMAFLAALFFVTIRGTWYAIEGETLIIYQFFRRTVCLWQKSKRSSMYAASSQGRHCLRAA